MFNWLKRKINKGPSLFDLIKHTYHTAGKDGASALTMTKCGKFGEQDVIVVVAIGNSVKTIETAYHSLEGKSVSTWDSTKGN